MVIKCVVFFFVISYRNVVTFYELNSCFHIDIMFNIVYWCPSCIFLDTDSKGVQHLSSDQQLFLCKDNISYRKLISLENKFYNVCTHTVSLLQAAKFCKPPPQENEQKPLPIFLPDFLSCQNCSFCLMKETFSSRLIGIVCYRV